MTIFLLCFNIVDPDCISFTCERRWDASENLFWFHLTWTLPPYLFDWNNVNYLHGFYVFARMLDGGGSVIDRLSSPQIPVPLQQVYTILYYRSLRDAAAHCTLLHVHLNNLQLMVCKIIL
jgi:hypothetical protein